MWNIFMGEYGGHKGKKDMAVPLHSSFLVKAMVLLRTFGT